MHKDRKLRRYRRKDYSEVVAFPVEIVGRDGMVRRYDFEASIRLYQRRMSHAALRFRDDDVVDAELGHCRARIEQLRRSFFHQYGWGTPEGQEGPEAALPAYAGELAGFLVRVLRTADRLNIRFERVESAMGHASVWYLSTAAVEAGLVLYAFDFGEGGEAPAVEAVWAGLLEELRAAANAGGDAERVVAVHRVTDCGFVLTGRADDVAGLAAAAPDASAPAEMAPTPWDEVRDMVRRGDFPTAFLRCRWVLEGQPWHRDAYAVGAMLGIVLRRASDAEDMAFVGTRYFERDALLAYYLGLARAHQGRRGAAIEALDHGLARDPGLVVARTLRLVLQVERGDLVAALRGMRAMDPGETPEAMQHADVVAAVARLALFVAAAALAVGLALASVVVAGKAALLYLFLVLSLVLLGVGVFRQQVTDLGHLVRDEDLQLAMRRIQRRRHEAPQA